jgi:hypothetical protein
MWSYPEMVEKLAHERLAKYWVPWSEMFECDVPAAQAAIKLASLRALNWRSATSGAAPTRRKIRHRRRHHSSMARNHDCV